MQKCTSTLSLHSNKQLKFACIWKIHGNQWRVKLSCKSYEDSESGWNIGLPTLLWHSAQLGEQSCQFNILTTLYLHRISLVLISQWTTELLNAEKINRSLENNKYAASILSKDWWMHTHYTLLSKLNFTCGKSFCWPCFWNVPVIIPENGPLKAETCWSDI